jgi:protein-L-isoaspartate(D-aspartate) O-methyltransferase
VAAAALCPLSSPSRAQAFTPERERMLDRIDELMQLTAAQTGRPRLSATIREAMGRVPRHRFVPEPQQASAYSDRALPIGEGQTISQPFIVALMTELLEPAPGQRILEVGTGSGYQAAVLAECGARVFTIEIVRSLGERAGALLAELGYRNVDVRIGDGYLGWPEQAPFDRIVVTAAPDHIPQPLLDQLAAGGRMVIPVGPERWQQDLLLITRSADGRTLTDNKIPVRFVPLTRAPGPG